MRNEFGYYELMGCHAQSTDEEVAAQWRSRARAAHPDRGGDPDAFARLSEAHAAIYSSASRARLARVLAVLGAACDRCGSTGEMRRQRGWDKVLSLPCDACRGAGFVP